MYKGSIDYAKIIRNLRKTYGKTQAELANEIGCGKTTICNYEARYSTPSLQVLEKIAEVFDITLAELLSADDPQASNPVFSFPRFPQTVNDTTVPYINSSSIPNGALMSDKYADSMLTLPGFMITEKENCFCIKVRDNAMANDGIHKNDFVFVHKTENIPNKSIVFATHADDNTYIIRRYWRDGHTVTLLPASDSTQYPVIRYDERNPQYRIVGYVSQALINVSKC